jgi:hypothetical protein
MSGSEKEFKEMQCKLETSSVIKIEQGLQEGHGIGGRSRDSLYSTLNPPAIFWN